MKIIAVLLILTAQSSFAKIDKIINTQTKSEIAYKNFISSLTDNGYIVMGEFHNTAHIQEAQAKVIRDKANSKKSTSPMNVMWEFLNFHDQRDINFNLLQLKQNQITVDDFIIETAGKQNLLYAPIIKEIVNYDSGLIGLNIARKYKKMAMDNGLNSLPNDMLPPNMRLGTSAYQERFTAAMGGHAPASVIQKYFLAQSLTDSTMSYQAASQELFTGINFIIAGSFHTDYFDGMIPQLSEIVASKVQTIKLIDLSIMPSDQDINELIYSKKYGKIADFVIFTSKD